MRIPVTQEFHGKRLDQALALLVPESSLRERRRLVEQELVLVNGRARAPGYKVYEGQMLELRQEASGEDELPEVFVVARTADFAALCKPAGLHTAALAGKPGDSVEARLADLFPGEEAMLVNRLDLETSGIVVAAMSQDAAQAYRAHEDAGAVWKTYLALVHGRVDRPLTLDQALDTAKRHKTRVLGTVAEKLRHTRIEPVTPDDTSLVRAIIQKGARHQIRAHLAEAGHPILGDTLYGNGEPDGLKLHHSHIFFPTFEASCSCPWNM